MKKTVADFISDFVAYDLGIETMFSVTGGGAMFLNDSFGNHEKLKVVYNHHEQASAMAAVGYAKANESYGLVCVTTGCGCTNALTGLLDAWQDNVPVIFISGQVKLKDTTAGTGFPVRQLGVQEANILKIVSNITKYSVMLTNPDLVKYELQKAAEIAKKGNPGPVWIDVPQDIQGASVETEKLVSFKGISREKTIDSDNIDFIQSALNSSHRPIILAGNGIRLSNQRQEFKQFVYKLKLPVVFSYLSLDLLPSDDELNIGRLGTKGDRAGNFAVQNADLVLVLGSRLSIPLTGFEYDKFARDAKIVVVDIDENEHSKKTVRIDNFIKGDLRDFFKIEDITLTKNYKDWLITCKKWKEMWPVYQQEYKNQSPINMYEFIDVLKDSSEENTHFVSDAGSAYYVTSQAIQLKSSQRYHTSGAQADMGFTLPASLGVSFAKPDSTVVGITGDGSFQMNIQELQLMKHHQPNLKLIIWNNSGYLSIKTTQRKFFQDRFAGTSEKNGLSFPESEKIASAYGLEFHRFDQANELRIALPNILRKKGPVVIEVICPEFQEVIPNVSAVKRADGSMLSKPLEDMYPFLDREVFNSEMIVKKIDE